MNNNARASPTQQPEKPAAFDVVDAAAAAAATKPSEIELAYYREFNVQSLYQMSPQPVTVTYYESVTNFSMQLCNSFNELDSLFAIFQEYCTTTMDGKQHTLKSEHVSVPNLAVAARFYDDQTWYRAKISKLL